MRRSPRNNNNSEVVVLEKNRRKGINVTELAISIGISFLLNGY
jgi:hypothetical protein